MVMVYCIKISKWACILKLAASFFPGPSVTHFYVQEESVVPVILQCTYLQGGRLVCQDLYISLPYFNEVACFRIRLYNAIRRQGLCQIVVKNALCWIGNG